MNFTPTEKKDIRGYQNDAGRFYPAVGSVLDLLFPSKMEWIDQAALDEGSRCHTDMESACLHHLTHGSWPTSENLRVLALIRYLEEHHFVPLEAERPRCSDVYGHAGKPDALIHAGNRFAVPDWKFAEGLDARYRFQVQAYSRLFPELPQIPAAILFRVDRDCRVLPTIVQPSAKHWTLFLNALACVQFRIK